MEKILGYGKIRDLPGIPGYQKPSKIFTLYSPELKKDSRHIYGFPSMLTNFKKGSRVKVTVEPVSEKEFFDAVYGKKVKK